MQPISAFKKRFLNIIILQFITLSVIVLTLTAIRFINNQLFLEIKAVYEKYLLSETKISLVLGGEEK